METKCPKCGSIKCLAVMGWGGMDISVTVHRCLDCGHEFEIEQVIEDDESNDD